MLHEWNEQTMMSPTINGREPPIWSDETRKVLFQLLREQCGLYASWPHRLHPANQDAYLGFCKMFATLTGATGGDAVRLQIEQALPLGRKVSYPTQRSRLAMNASAAYSAGFLTMSELDATLSQLNYATSSDQKQDSA
jgi:hypothetical protein